MIFLEDIIYIWILIYLKLTDVMVDTEPMKTGPVESQLMSDFNRTTKLSLKGKFGAQLSKEIVGNYILHFCHFCFRICLRSFYKLTHLFDIKGPFIPSDGLSIFSLLHPV
jgi:hypothetical protein